MQRHDFSVDVNATPEEAWEVVRGGRELIEVRLFLYGTLMPGHDAWPLIEPAAIDVAPAQARGALYDTGLGYPAACFTTALDGPALHGVVVTVESAQAHTLLARLDRFEGADYRRVQIVLADGQPAEAYDWIGPRHGLRRVADGRWPKPEAGAADQ